MSSFIYFQFNHLKVIFLQLSTFFCIFVFFYGNLTFSVTENLFFFQKQIIKSLFLIEKPLELTQLLWVKKQSLKHRHCFEMFESSENFLALFKLIYFAELLCWFEEKDLILKCQPPLLPPQMTHFKEFHRNCKWSLYVNSFSNCSKTHTNSNLFLVVICVT